MEIDVTIVSESLTFEGETYFFCSEGGRAEFIRHAAEYIGASRIDSADSFTEREDV